MNTKAKEVAVIPPKPLTVQERAAAVFAAVPSEEALRELAKKSATITAITNEDGKSQCHAARMVLKNTRLEIARVGEEGREDAVQTSKAIIAIQKSRIGLISPEETRLQAIQDEWDARIEREKQRRIDEEVARVAEIQRLIDGIRNWPVKAANDGSALVAQKLREAQDYRITESAFQEFAPVATQALQVSVAALTGLLAQAKEREEKEAQLEEDRKELARLRAEQAERDRVAAAERAAQEAADRARREEEQRQRDEANRLERAAIAAEAAATAERLRKEQEAAAEVLRQQRAENDRIAAERQAELGREAAENARIAAERRAELDLAEEAARQERAAEAQRQAQAAAELAAREEALRTKPEKRHGQRPSRDAIVQCVAEKFEVKPERAQTWLREIDWEAVT